MTRLRDLDRDDVAAAAAAALARATGEAVRIADVEPLSDADRRNLILRAKAIRDGRDSQPVIIKATRAPSYNAAAENAFTESGLVKEWTATALLSARAPGRRNSATFLAGDAAHGILVFEDLGAGLGSLVAPLLEGTAADAERALVAYAAALGRLHADTAACTAEHAQTLRAAFPTARPPAPRHHERLGRIATTLDDRIGGQPPPDEIALIAQRLQEPGPWLSLVHGDPCPDNALIVDGRVRLIDFEFAAPGHALLDAAYWRIGFPTCWCAGRVPDAIAARAEAAYRVEAGQVIGIVHDDVAFATETAWIAAAWLLASLDWRLDPAIAEDRTWGIASMRSRLLWYLDATIAMTVRADILPGLRATAAAWRAELQARWPTTTALDVYPAFADRPKP